MQQRPPPALPCMLIAAWLAAPAHAQRAHPALEVGISFAYTLSDRRFADLQPYVFTLHERDDARFVFRIECAGNSMTCIPRDRVYDHNLLEIGWVSAPGETTLRTRFVDAFSLFPLRPGTSVTAGAVDVDAHGRETPVRYRISVAALEQWSAGGAARYDVVPVRIERHRVPAGGAVHPCSDNGGPARAAGTVGRGDAAAERSGPYSQRDPAARTGPYGAIPPLTESECGAAAGVLSDEIRYYSPVHGFWVRSTIREQGQAAVEVTLAGRGSR